MNAEPHHRFGVGLRTRYYPEALSGGLGVTWVEVITENFLGRGGRPAQVLERVRRDAHLLLHGVSLSIGGTAPLDEPYLALLADLVRRCEPEVVSDHLCFSGFGGHWGHDLWPVPYTTEALDHVVRRVHWVQDHLGRRIALENPSRYVAFANDELNEWEFFNELCRRTGCRMLLDINNVFVSAHNIGFDAAEYLDAIEVGSVAQMHLAGHTRCDGYLLDDHSGPVADPVWCLFDTFSQRGPEVPIVLEWDGEVPELSIVLAEARRIPEHLALTRNAA